MSYISTILADSPLAGWRLGESSGTAADAVGSATGTYINTPTLGVAGLLTGDADTAVTFTKSSSEYVNVPTGLPAGSSAGASAEAWVKFAANTGRHYLLSWGAPSGGTHQFYFEDGWFTWTFWDTAHRVAAVAWTPTVGTTYYLAAVHDYVAKTAKFYVNGAQQGSTNDLSGYGTPVPPAANAASMIGSYMWDELAASLDGTLDEVFVYAPLTGTQIAAHYAAGTATGPVWTTPADTVSMSTTPDLKFTSPASAVKQHFQLQLDTANTFDTGNLRTLDSSTSQTNWTYWNGSTWVAIPSDGLPIAYAGNEVDYTVTSALSGATWYRRVRAGTLV